MADLSGREVGSLLFTVKAIATSPSVSAENPRLRLLLKLRGTWKDFSDVLVKDVRSSLIRAGAGWYITPSHCNVSWSTF